MLYLGEPVFSYLHTFCHTFCFALWPALTLQDSLVFSLLFLETTLIRFPYSLVRYYLSVN